MKVVVRASHHTVQSVEASVSPDRRAFFTGLSSTPHTSSIILS